MKEPMYESEPSDTESDSSDPEFDPEKSDSDSDSQSESESMGESEDSDCILFRAGTSPGSGYSPVEQAFLKRLSAAEREALEKKEKELLSGGGGGEGTVPLRFRILRSEMPDALKLMGLQKLQQLAGMDTGSEEYNKMMTWLDGFARLPLGRYRALPISAADPVEKTHGFLSGLFNRLDEVVYGHTETKVQVVQSFARWIANPHSRGLVLGIQGPPGVGKTSLVKEGICEGLGLPFASIPLGGANDVSYLDGHSFTYVGSRWGRLVDGLMSVGVMNPVLYFDELDKVSESARGQEIVNLLIHLTDPAQNGSFQDKYFHGVEMDLSKAIVIFSYNHEDQINPILRDRFVTVHLQGYTEKQKLEIARSYLLPSVLRDYGLRGEDIVIPEEVMREILHRTAEEQGVRGLRRNLDTIVGNVNVLRWVPYEDQARFVSSPNFKSMSVTFPFQVETRHLAFFLRPRGEVNISHAMMYT